MESAKMWAHKQIGLVGGYKHHRITATSAVMSSVLGEASMKFNTAERGLEPISGALSPALSLMIWHNRSSPNVSLFSLKVPRTPSVVIRSMSPVSNGSVFFKGCISALRLTKLVGVSWITVQRMLRKLRIVMGYQNSVTTQ